MFLMQAARSIAAMLVLVFVTTFAFGQTDNTSLGTGAGASITTGDYNTLFGDSAGTNLSSGSYNVFIGEDAGLTCSTCSDNIFIGEDAGYSNTTVLSADS